MVTGLGSWCNVLAYNREKRIQHGRYDGEDDDGDDKDEEE